MEKNLNNSHAMGTDSITRLMWRFSLPAIVGMLANALYNIVDRLFVGQTVGAAGIGAISVVFPFMILVISFDLLVGVGAGSLISISLGEKRRARAERDGERDHAPCRRRNPSGSFGRLVHRVYS